MYKYIYTHTHNFYNTYNHYYSITYRKGNEIDFRHVMPAKATQPSDL